MTRKITEEKFKLYQSRIAVLFDDLPEKKSIDNDIKNALENAFHRHDFEEVIVAEILLFINEELLQIVHFGKASLKRLKELLEYKGLKIGELQNYFDLFHAGEHPLKQHEISVYKYANQKKGTLNAAFAKLRQELGLPEDPSLKTEFSESVFTITAEEAIAAGVRPEVFERLSQDPQVKEIALVTAFRGLQDAEDKASEEARRLYLETQQGINPPEPP